MKKSANQETYEWYILGVIGIALFALGIAGFARYAAWHNLPTSFWDHLYLTLQLIPMNSGGLEPPVPWELNLARFLIPVLAATTVIKAFWEIFREQIHMLRLRRLKRHVIICGLSRKGLLLANQFRQRGEEVVIIEVNEENKWLGSCRQQKMFVLIGDATDPNLLKRAGVGEARGLFAVCENDGVNAAIIVQSQELTQNRTGEALTCLAHIADPQLCRLLREQESSLEHAPFQLELFNVFEHGARQLLNEYPAWNEESLKSGATPNLLVLGLGRMGENVVIHIARDWWNQQPDRKKHPQITIIDRKAMSIAASLSARYPQLNQACELIPIEIDVHSSEFERATFLDKRKGKGFDRIYICLDNDALGLHAALTLLRHIPNNSSSIIIRMTEEGGLARLLKNRKQSYKSLFAFGYLGKTCTPDLLESTPRDILARAAHEQYLQQLRITQNDLQDPLSQPWELLDEQYRKDNYHWVDHIRSLLEEIGYAIAPLTDWDAPSIQIPPNQIEHMAQMEHEKWCKDKESDGWRFAPGPKDVKAKTSPDLVPWNELPESERKKNRALINGIPAFLAKAGYQMSLTAAPNEENKSIE